MKTLGIVVTILAVAGGAMAQTPTPLSATAQIESGSALAKALNAYEHMERDFERGVEFLRECDYQQAVASLTYCLDAHPRKHLWFERLGRVMYEAAEHNPALERYRRTFDTTDIPERLAVAKALLESGSPSAAIHEYAAILKQHPLCVEALNGLAYTNQMSGNIQDAISAFALSLSLDPNNESVARQLQRCLRSRHSR